ncbi:MAG: hypothetical protein AAB515_02715 [Patescibacteria group bacterium]
MFWSKRISICSLPILLLINVLTFESVTWAGDYVPTASQVKAQKIMGQNYLGPDAVMHALNVRYTPEELKKLETVPFTDAVLQGFSVTHVLVAGYSCTIKTLQKACNSDSFKIEFMDLSLNGSNWYDYEKFVHDSVKVEWMLVPIKVSTATAEKHYTAQSLTDDCTVCAPRATELVFASVVATLAGEVTLFDKQVVSCREKDSQGYDIFVGSNLKHMAGHTSKILVGSVWEDRQYRARRTIIYK